MNKTVLILLVSMICTQTGYAYINEDSLSIHSYKKAVHELLSPNEIFIQFRDVYTTGIYEYVAIVVDPNADNPVVTYLFESESLHSYARENCTNKDLGQLVWSPLQPLLQGKSTIYFSASGELYNYPIEYLRCPEDTDKQMNEVYKMYRLSGIEQLARQEINASEQKKAVVFGGLEYDLSADTNDNSESKLLAFRGNVSGLTTLPETRKEVTYIDSILRKENILVSLQTGNSGGKSAFHEVTQSNATMLHLATHGFYNPQHYLTNESRLKKWMMSRTGICLAGDYYNTDKEYNGLMTGRDISSMDMENLDLVVLSACQTGLGDVFEGKQYGLSNAFKDAKAKSILASLWSVHDDATKLLMIRFYSNLIKGLEKCEALKEAQSFVRNYSVESKASGKGKNSAEREKSGAYDAGRKPYQSPIYWASFVMIDANKPLQTTVSKETLDFINQFKSENMLGSFVDEDIDNWEKYKEFLKPEDALIYFYNYTLPNGEDEYVALIYTPERIEGTLVPVIRSKEKNPDWEVWQSISDTIYERLYPYINGKQRILFRPTGMLNYTPLEALWDNYHPESSCYRISSGESLRMLAEEPKRLDTALLIGGLDYSYEKDSFHNEHGLPSSGRWYASPGVVNILFSSLPETKLEVEHIDSILRPSLHHIMLLQKKDATEKQLRNHLTGNQFDIIHIASHSTFFSIKQALESTAIQPFIQSRTYSSLRENLLACNILALSEAEIINYADLGTGIDADKNNILTGLEVFQMDLSDVSLVVIAGSNSLCSASTSCQNFGLAYALKHAGVKTVMACIWEVADTCTQLIMTEFYKQCISGKNMHDALRIAQQYVRDYQEVEEEPVMLNDNLTLSEKRKMELEGISTEKQSVIRTTHPYESPRYWAPFVLLDAVN